MKRRHATFYNGQGKSITKWEAAQKYPDPVFFERPTASMTPDEMRAMLARNIAEIEYALKVFATPYATGNVRGTVRKRDLMWWTNKLHDWRVSLHIMGGELGRPYLWEE